MWKFCAILAFSLLFEAETKVPPVAQVLSIEGEVIRRGPGLEPGQVQIGDEVADRNLLLTGPSSKVAIRIQNLGAIMLYENSILEVKYLANPVLNGLTLLKGKMDIHKNGKKRIQMICGAGTLRSNTPFIARIVKDTEDKARIFLTSGAMNARPYFSEKEKQVVGLKKITLESEKMRIRALKKANVFLEVQLISSISDESLPDPRLFASWEFYRKKLSRLSSALKKTTLRKIKKQFRRKPQPVYGNLEFRKDSYTGSFVYTNRAFILENATGFHKIDLPAKKAKKKTQRKAKRKNKLRKVIVVR